MSSKTIFTVALVLAMFTSAVTAAEKPVADAAASRAIPADPMIHWKQSIAVAHGSTAHAQLIRFLQQHVSGLDTPATSASVKGDFQVSFGHTVHGAPTRQPDADAYAPPYDPAAKGLYAKGDTLIAVTCLDRTRRSWHFVYQPTSHGDDRLQWESTGISYHLLSPKGHCPPASQWLPDEAKNLPAQGSPETVGATPAS